MKTTKSYSEKLSDPRWQKKRLEIMNRDNWTCRVCGDKDNQLQVHHRYYVSKRAPWEYPDVAFQTLCKECHSTNSDLDEAGNYHAAEWELLGEVMSDSGLVDTFNIAADFAMTAKRLGLNHSEMGKKLQTILQNL